MILFVRHTMENPLLVALMGGLVIMVPVFGISFIHRPDALKKHGRDGSPESEELLQFPSDENK